MTNGADSDIVSHFRAGLDVIKRYPVMALPPLAAQAIVFVLTLLFVGGAATAVVIGGGAGLLGAFAGGFVLMLVGGLLSLIASGVTVMMARDALAAREPSMGDAFAAVMARLGDVIVASILVMIIVGIGMMLLVLPGIVAGFFLMFTLPAVLLDGSGAVDGLKRSATLVKDNIGPAVGLVVGIILAGVVVAIVSGVLRHVPILGHLASAILTGAFIAYFTAVAVRVYQALPRR
jgi:hypothetical protein